MIESSPSVTKSPRLAAIGVATLSGLIFTRCEIKITMIITEAKTRLAMAALPMAEAARISMCDVARSPPTDIEMRVARPATIRAWPCGGRGGRGV